MTSGYQEIGTSIAKDSTIEVNTQQNREQGLACYSNDENHKSEYRYHHHPTDVVSLYSRRCGIKVIAWVVFMLAGMLLLALLRESRHRSAAGLFGAGDPYNAVDGETCAEMQSADTLFSFLLPCATFAPIDDQTTEMRCLSADESASIINSQLSSWELVRGDKGDSIHRSFEFKDFQHAFFFMSKSAQNAEKNAHHPLWTNVWNTVDVTWTTDDRQCLSTYDVASATAMDILFDAQL